MGTFETPRRPARPSVSQDELAHLINMASCAPSVHNSQPWRFVPTSDGVLVHADRTRGLAVIDPEGRQLLISCGAALDHLRVAARAIGLDTAVTLLPYADEPDTVAHVRLTPGGPATLGEVDAAVSVLHRHTVRGRFADDPVPTPALEAMHEAVEARGTLLRVVRPRELLDVEVLVSRAEQALHRIPAYDEELARWVWDGASVAGRDDGMPFDAVGHGAGRAESLQGRAFRPAPPVAVDPPPVREDPTAVLLSTVGDAPVDWLRAGQALSALLLTATRLGLVAQPIGQVLDLPWSRAALQRSLGTIGAPQLLLRLGVGRAGATSPRRPLADVVA